MAVNSSDEQIIQGLNAASPSSLVLAQKKKYEEDEKEKNRQRQIIAFDFNDAEYEALDSTNKDAMDAFVNAFNYTAKRALIVLSMFVIFMLSGIILSSVITSVFVGIMGGLGLWAVGKGISKLIFNAKNKIKNEQEQSNEQDIAKFVFSAYSYTFRFINHDKLFFDVGCTAACSGVSLAIIVLPMIALGWAPLIPAFVFVIGMILLSAGSAICWGSSYFKNSKQAPQLLENVTSTPGIKSGAGDVNANTLQRAYRYQIQPESIALPLNNDSNQKSYRTFSAASTAIVHALVGLGVFRKPQQQIEQQSPANANQNEQPTVRRMGKVKNR